jgi:ribonuclease HI
MTREDALNVYTDGSSLPKPRRGGIGVRLVYVNEAGEEIIEDQELPGHEGATNNEMELLACIRGMEIAFEHPIAQRHKRICVFTDSMYVQENFERALFQWSQSKWLNSNGRPVENADLWKQLVRLRKKTAMRVEIKWVQGHSKDVHNKAVDRLAKKSAKGALQAPLKVTSIRRKLTALSTEVGAVRLRGQVVSIRIITDHYMRSQKTYKYKFEVLPGQEDGEKVDVVFSAHCLRAGHHYSVRMNTDPANPRILEVIDEIEKRPHAECSGPG